MWWSKCGVMSAPRVVFGMIFSRKPKGFFYSMNSIPSILVQYELCCHLVEEEDEAVDDGKGFPPCFG